MVAFVANTKVSTKLRILQALADKACHIIVGGNTANTLMAAGLPIGKSLAELEMLDDARAVRTKMQIKNDRVPIPVCVVVG